MPFELSRAHKRFLRLTGQRCPRSDAENTPPAGIEVTDQPRGFFRQALEAGGSHRGGALFGRLYNGLITVKYAMPSGYICWPQPGQDSPLMLDRRYMLGLTDAFQASSPEPIDWVGNWLIFPNSELPAQSEAVAWFDQAALTKLVDAEHCLLMVGWSESRLAAHACVTGEYPGQMVLLPHNLAARPPITSP